MVSVYRYRFTVVRKDLKSFFGEQAMMSIFPVISTPVSVKNAKTVFFGER